MRQAEDAGNEEAKKLWQPHLLTASKNLAAAVAVFDEMEEKRLQLTIEAAKVEAEAKFAQAKADAANKIRGAQCPSFTSYIELEEYYAAQIETGFVTSQPWAEQTLPYASASQYPVSGAAVKLSGKPGRLSKNISVVPA